jgi:tRNA wybutosine-synthesizing protein 1
MDNVPWHEEVIEFVEKLTERLTGYAIACEHEHSNCILLADKKFLIDGKWNTWIDYQK